MHYLNGATQRMGCGYYNSSRGEVTMDSDIWSNQPTRWKQAQSKVDSQVLEATYEGVTLAISKMIPPNGSIESEIDEIPKYSLLILFSVASIMETIIALYRTLVSPRVMWTTWMGCNIMSLFVSNSINLTFFGLPWAKNGMWVSISW